MKDRTTHLAYEPERAVDLDTGAVVVAAMHAADEGDTTTLAGTEAAEANLAEVGMAPTGGRAGRTRRRRNHSAALRQDWGDGEFTREAAAIGPANAQLTPLNEAPVSRSIRDPFDEALQICRPLDTSHTRIENGLGDSPGDMQRRRQYLRLRRID